MRTYLVSAALLAVSVAVLPAVPVMLTGGDGHISEESQGSPEIREYVPEEESTEMLCGEPYRVLDVSTGEVLEVPVSDYVKGAVCAEMPATFEPEALKAQAVAAHTYAERQRMLERSSPEPELMGADFSNDTSKYQGYFTQSQARSYFGDSYEMNYRKISDAVDEVLPYILTYEDEPIISAFHSMSSGVTESAENAWGAHVDYLVPVESPGDKEAPKYREEYRFGKAELKEMLEKAFPDIVLEGDMKEWLTVTDISDSGTVLALQAGDMQLTGNQIRTALGLRSACFDIRTEGEQAVFTTRGFGHGVGMSQYGANTMAKSGSSWQEILAHYYPGCSISETE